MTVKDFSEKASLVALCLPEGDREITGGYVGDLLSWVMGRAKAGDAWLTIMSNQNILAVASLADVACIILTEGVTLEQDVLRLAEQKGINVLSSQKDSFSVAALLSSELL